MTMNDLQSADAEPAIVVNGVALTHGECMTVRVALSNFALDLMHNGLGDDDHGQRMVRAYLEAIRSIHRIMCPPGLTDDT